MNVREMHIDINQSTQLVAANRTRKWYPEEIDWVLNKIQERFIRSKLRPKTDGKNVTGGFELDQIGTDDIRMLLVVNKIIRPYIEDETKYKCVLPPDYSYLISDGSYTKLLCGATPTIATETLFITSLRQDYSSKNVVPYYETLTVTQPDKFIVIPTDLPYQHNYVGYANKEDISFLIPWILWKSNWYWESFGNENYNPSHYVQVQTTTPNTPSTTIDGVTTNNYSTITKSWSYHNQEGKQVNNRLVSSDIIRSLKQAAFYRTLYSSPLTELQGNILWVYRDNNFTVSKVEISYIRKPRPISLSLNSNCELAEGVHRLICDLATEYLQGKAKDLQSTQMTEADISKRIIL